MKKASTACFSVEKQALAGFGSESQKVINTKIVQTYLLLQTLKQAVLTTFCDYVLTNIIMKTILCSFISANTQKTGSGIVMLYSMCFLMYQVLFVKMF